MDKITKKLFFITVFFNIWLPKGGFKIVGLPFTFGNISFGLLIISFLLSLKDNKIIKRDIFKMLLFTSLYFFIRVTIALFSYTSNIAEVAQYLVPLSIYPMMYFFTIQSVKTKEDIDKVMKILIFGFIFICVYGILQYFLGIEMITIPGITMNISDYTGPLWYLEKYNGVAADSKIFSTYQNGNLFGVSLILIFPIIFEYLQNKFSDNKKLNKILYMLLGLFSVTILLTLSRSCWFGLCLYITIRFVFTKVNSFRRLLVKIGMIPVGTLIFIYMLKKFPQILQRINNTSFENLIGLGGRTEGFNQMINSLLTTDSFFILFIGFFGIYRMNGFVYEITPAAIWMVGGVIGVVLWYSTFAKAIKDCGSNNSISRGVVYSSIIWVIVSVIEGAFWLPPTVLNLWFILGFASNCKYIIGKKEKNNNMKELC